MDTQALCAEFPRAEIHWRSQTLTKDASKALALAYIDARHVMQRLDDVLGPACWQDRYEVHGEKTICYLSIRIGDEWVTKSDGAGDTDVEKEKGSISDAFKRAAVKWGIGRYLYKLPAVWVPCKTYEVQGKKRFGAFTEDPWQYVVSKPKPKSSSRETYDAMISEIQSKNTMEMLEVFVKGERARKDYESLPHDWKESFVSELNAHKTTLKNQMEAAQ